MALHDDLIPPELTVDSEPFDPGELDAILAGYDDADMALLFDSWADDNPDDYVPERAAVMRWTITDDDLAEWAMAHVAQIDAGLEQLAEQKRERIARINRWHDAATRRLTQRRGFFAHHLTQYAAAFRARDPKRNKTLHLTNGVVSSSEAQPKVVVGNATTIIRWAVEHMTTDDLLAIVKNDVLVSELRKRTTIVLRPVGYRVKLDCGHEHLVPVINPATNTPHTPESLHADGMVCDECDRDPIDGHPHRTVTEVGDWDERAVVMPTTIDGRATAVVVEGANIDAGGVTFTVKPS